MFRRITQWLAERRERAEYARYTAHTRVTSTDLLASGAIGNLANGSAETNSTAATPPVSSGNAVTGAVIGGVIGGVPGAVIGAVLMDD